MEDVRLSGPVRDCQMIIFYMLFTLAFQSFVHGREQLRCDWIERIF